MIALSDDTELRSQVIAALGRGRGIRPPTNPTITTRGLDVLVDGTPVCRALTADQPGVIRWLRSLLRRWSAAARRRARRRRAYLFGPERRCDIAAVERALAARRGAR